MGFPFCVPDCFDFNGKGTKAIQRGYLGACISSGNFDDQLSYMQHHGAIITAHRTIYVKYIMTTKPYVLYLQEEICTQNFKVLQSKFKIRYI